MPRNAIKLNKNTAVASRLPLGFALAMASAFALPLAGQAQAQTQNQTQTTEPSTPADKPLLDAAVIDPPRYNYVIGGSVNSTQSNLNGGGSESKFRPILSVRYGRFRLSTSRAGAVSGFDSGLVRQDTLPSQLGRDVALLKRLNLETPDASYDFITPGNWSAAASLRLDSGRSPNSTPSISSPLTLVGLPEIRRTLRGRVSVGWAFAEAWSVGLSVSQDLLGRAGGMTGSVDLGYKTRLTPQTEGTLSAGVGFANARYNRTYFGINAQTAAANNIGVFEPSHSANDIHASAGFTTALSEQWIVFGGVGVSRLVGAAANSPITRPSAGPGSQGHLSSTNASIGLAYRFSK